MSDRQGDDDPPQRPGARGIEVREHHLRVLAELSTTLVFARISSEELAGEKIVCVDQEQITDVRDDATVKQRYGRLVTQPLDIECIARCDVKKAFPELGRASVGIRAAKVLVTFLLRGDRGAAFGALTWHDEGTLVAGPGFDHRADDFRDDIPGFAQKDHVPDQDTFALHFVLVVQRRHRHRRSRNTYRFHDGKGSDATGASDIDSDIQQACANHLGWVLEGNGPTRGTRGLP